MAEIITPEIEFTNTFEPGDIVAASESPEIRTRDMLMVPIDEIHTVANYNIRIHDAAYEAHVERIKNSIMANGFYRHAPLKCYVAKEDGQNLFYLVGGYSRYEAAKRAIEDGAKLERLPVVLTPKGTSMDDLLIGLDRDNDGKPLSPYERGIIVKRLQALDNEEDEIANKLGISTTYVNDLLLLMGSPKELHNMVTSGEVSAGLAMQMLKEHKSGKAAVKALKDAGATGERRTNGAAGPPVTRVTRTNVGRTGGTDAPNKRLYECLIEYLIVLNSTSGADSAMGFLLRWNDKEKDAIKELSKIASPDKKKKKGKTPNPKDVRIKVTKGMSDDEKAAAREHNKVVKKRADRRAARAAAAATEEPAADDNEAI